jgi:hypothetical protein
MKARSVVVALVAVGGMLLAAQGTASANVAWCVADPPVQVVTPGGTILSVNNLVWLPPSALHLKNRMWDQASAAPDGTGGTRITVTVHVPAGVAAHVQSSEYRYQVSTQGDGWSAVTLYLDVPTS